MYFRLRGGRQLSRWCFNVAQDTYVYTLWPYAAPTSSKCGLSDRISMRPQCVFGAFTPLLRVLTRALHTDWGDCFTSDAWGNSRYPLRYWGISSPAPSRAPWRGASPPGTEQDWTGPQGRAKSGSFGWTHHRRRSTVHQRHLHKLKEQVKSSLFIQPSITNHSLPQGASQSVQHTTPSVLRPSTRIRNTDPPKKNPLTGKTNRRNHQSAWLCDK